MGAVYQAAALSKAFKVKPFLVRDAAVFPIQVSIQVLRCLKLSASWVQSYLIELWLVWLE